MAQLCPTLSSPMECSTSGFPVHHQLSDLGQNHVHWVGDAIQPSVPLLSSFPPTFNLSQHQGLFRRVRSSHQVAKVLELQLQHQSFNEYSGLIPLWLTGSNSLPSKGLSRVFPPQFKSISSSVLSFLYTPTLTSVMTTGKTIALSRWTFAGKVISLLFNMLSRLVITFLPRSKHPLISWLQSPYAVMWSLKK